MDQEALLNMQQLAQAEIAAMQQAFAAQQAAANEAIGNMQQQLQAVQQEAAVQVNALQQQLAAVNIAAPPMVEPPPAHDPGLPRGLRLPPLDTFTGKKGEDLEAFLFQLKEHLETTRVLDNTLQVRVAGMALRGPAKTWYTYVRNPATPENEQVKTFKEFEDGIRAHFTPIDPIKIARDQLADLKQTGSVRDYTALFRQLNTRIPTLSEDERLDRYIRGLKPRTRKEVEIREPASYDDATRLAEKLDVAFERAYTSDRCDRSDRSDRRPQSTRHYPSRSDSSYTAGHSSGSDPMILGTMQGPKKGPLTQQEKDRRKAMGLCLYCGDKNHDIDTCTLKPKGRPNHFSGPRNPQPGPGNGRQRPQGA